jgi:hypothetical protein
MHLFKQVLTLRLVPTCGEGGGPCASMLGDGSELFRAAAEDGVCAVGTRKAADEEEEDDNEDEVEKKLEEGRVLILLLEVAGDFATAGVVVVTGRRIVSACFRALSVRMAIIWRCLAPTGETAAAAAAAVEVREGDVSVEELTAAADADADETDDAVAEHEWIGTDSEQNSVSVVNIGTQKSIGTVSMCPA